MAWKHARILAVIGMTCISLVCGMLAPGHAQIPRAGHRPLVVLATIDGPIYEPTREYMARVVSVASASHADCILVEMDTPGGAGDAMRSIARLFLTSRVPVVVFVTPRGAQAASAGAVIALSANVIAMSPNTTIGAAHPVTGEGGNIPADLREKIVNDMTAFLRSIAQSRGRNVEWAQNIVRKSISSSETEALRLGIADVLASGRGELLRVLDGRKVSMGAETRVLHTAGAEINEQRATWVEALLLLLCNPNIALILGAVALYGLITEVSNPGAIFPGVVGIIALVLSLYSMSVLSVTGTGVALLVLALILFGVDVYAPTHGVLTVGGAVSFVFGALMLFGDPVTHSQVSTTVVVTLAVVTALFFGTIVAASVRSIRHPQAAGPETLVGAIAEARTPLTPHGNVFVDGALWAAINIGESPVEPGDQVVVMARQGLMLQVRRTEPKTVGPVYSRE